MAHEVVKRITILVHQSHQDRVIDTLQRIGTVHIDSVETEEDLGSRTLTEEETELSRSYAFKVSQVDFILDLLKQHSREKQGFLKGMIKDKYPMTFDEFSRSEERVNLEKVYSECSKLEQRLIQLREEDAQFQQEKEELGDWKDLDMSLDGLVGGSSYGLTTVNVASNAVGALVQELDSEAPASAVTVVGEARGWSQCVIVFYLKEQEKVSSILSGFKHEPVALPIIAKTPAERLEQIEGQASGIEAQREELIEELEKYGEFVADLSIAREFFRNQLAKLEAKSSLGVTSKSTVIEGWVTEGGIEESRRCLADLCDEIEVEVSEPGEDKVPPISLKNRKIFKPFELLTSLYGMPNNREYDPTWLIAISFVIFFGFCIGDVGYGLVIIVGFLLMRKFLPLGKNTRDLLLVLVYGGAFAMVVGVLTGSWFGYDPEKLPQFMQAMAVFDPLKDPIPIMGVCMGLGLVHMLAGTGVEFRDSWRAGNKAGALIDQGLVLFLFIGSIAAAVLVIVGVFPTNAVFLVAGVALLGMIIFMGHKSKSVPGKMFGGLYETYNTLVGWLGDTVSYLRLFALGLATFAVGWVINILAGMVLGMAPVIGILFMIVVLLVGHTFNVAVNLLGAFVHPLRLEYVEFFSKFYEDGGNRFDPLRVESNIVMIEE